MRVIVGAIALLAAGCAPKGGDKVAAQIETVRAEETKEKLLARGRAFQAVGDFARAEQYFAAALDRGAEPHVALPLLLRVCAEERRYRAAIDYAEPQLKKHPEDYHLRFVVASFYTTIGESVTAREELERITKDHGDFAPAHFALGVILRDETGDVVAADRHFREYLRISPRGPHADEAQASLLKLVEHGGKPITTPPVWHDVPTPADDGKKKKAP